MTRRYMTVGILFFFLFNGLLPAQQETTKVTLQKDDNSVEKLPLFIKAREASAERYKFAAGKGAQILPTPDGRSFYILWFPKGTSSKNPPPMIFTLHGHGSWAFDEFFLWQPHIAKAGYGIVALQWWFGEGEKPNDYYLPREIVHNMAKILGVQNIAKRSVLAHGFSRGSANIYGVTALDNKTDKFIFMTIANAGKAGDDFPINREIENGLLGPQPLKDTLWITYAGANDPHPDRDGIAGMRKAQDWIKRYGGSIVSAIEDAKGDHGGFHRNPANVENALDTFKRSLNDAENQKKKK
ncbi:MAG TPA: hypothetical protein DCZ94_11925 [Lentisphaeria bacterium]|nr:MAG: hypothetical protein A2X48_09475 [Lentisphaerae bacterium GWF2_49_21]HBC87656.1 hypothetical protein [Lentisphaeria bacterium]